MSGPVTGASTGAAAGLPPPAAGDDAWAAFAAPRDGMAFLTAWFRLVIADLPGLGTAILVLDQSGSFVTAATHPQSATADLLEPLLALARRARPDQAETLVQAAPGGGRLIGYPVSIDGRLHGLLLWSTSERSPKATETALRRLHWGSGWLHSLVLRQQVASSEGARSRMSSLLSVLAAMEDQPGLDAALRGLAEASASQMRADRVAVFLLQGGKLKLGALTGATGPEKQARDLASLRAAADEARLQGRALTLPAATEGVAILAAHNAHARRSGLAALLSVPMRARGETIGCLTFERMAAGPAAAFLPAEIELADALASGGAASLGPKIDEHRLVSGRLRLMAGKLLKKLFGPNHPAMKLVGLLVLAAALALAFLPVPQRISARAVVQGAEERVVTAPFSGFIAEASQRAGDRVTEGTPLARMADDDLRLELMARQGEIAALEQEARAALAKGDRAAQAEAEARIAAARAALDLSQAQLARAALLAPLAGVIVEGDLSQQLGAPVQSGDVLFRIAAESGYKAALEIGEYDIGAVSEGMSGTLALAGLSGAPVPVVLERIGPVSEVSGAGGNVFRAEAQLPADQAARLRPGLEGVVKIEVGKAPLGVVLARPMLQRLKYFFWRWTP